MVAGCLAKLARRNKTKAEREPVECREKALPFPGWALVAANIGSKPGAWIIVPGKAEA